MILMNDSVALLKGEIRCWSLLRAKRLRRFKWIASGSGFEFQEEEGGKGWGGEGKGGE